MPCRVQLLTLVMYCNECKRKDMQIAPFAVCVALTIFNFEESIPSIITRTGILLEKHFVRCYSPFYYPPLVANRSARSLTMLERKEQLNRIVLLSLRSIVICFDGWKSLQTSHSAQTWPLLSIDKILSAIIHYSCKSSELNAK